jgi:acyl dehydratase
MTEASLSTASSEHSGVRTWPKGHHFEDFTVGQAFTHHWGRTILESDNATFSALTLSYHPTYFNLPYAREQGHPGLVANPMLVFLVTFGMSVQDLSEAGGAFLGVDDLAFHRPVSVGETLVARSTVVAVKDSASRPHQGIVTWRTEGFRYGADGHGEPVISFTRTNLINRREAS